MIALRDVEPNKSMSKGDEMKLGSKIVLVACLAFLQVLGLMLIDYGASAKNLGRNDIFFQSLAFDKIDSRTTYNLGLLFVTASYLCLTALAVNELTRDLQ
jgi:hypothetical protein